MRDAKYIIFAFVMLGCPDRAEHNMWKCEYYNYENVEKGEKACTLDQNTECPYSECYNDDSEE